jgi:hypothetical protein
MNPVTLVFVIRGHSMLSKDLGPKRCPNTWRKYNSKETKESIKVEEGGVHHNKNDVHCKKQWVKISKVTLRFEHHPF